LGDQGNVPSPSEISGYVPDLTIQLQQLFNSQK
jgi:hypothetical protein